MEKDDTENVYHDTVINFYMNNPELYDKVEEDYSVNACKVEKLTVLSNYLKQLHINKEVADIIRTWQELVKLFKQQLAAENSAKSGSGATKNKFPYYNSLLFLKPACEGRPTLSTISLSTKRSVDAQQSGSAINTSSPSLSITELSSPTFGSHHDHSYVEAVPSTSTAQSSIRRKTPKLDDFAVKKFKSIDESEKDMHKLGQKLMATLDDINKKANNKENEPRVMNESGSTILNYRRLLTEAVNKIPAGQENHCLQFILEDLENFDKHK